MKQVRDVIKTDGKDIDESIGLAASKYAGITSPEGNGTNVTKFNSFVQGCDHVLNLPVELTPTNIHSATGVERIAIERNEQINKHGYSLDHDYENNKNAELREAIQFLITGDRNVFPRSWDLKWMEKFEHKTMAEKMILIGTFAAAEYDRITPPKKAPFVTRKEHAKMYDYSVCKECEINKVENEGEICSQCETAREQ